MSNAKISVGVLQRISEFLADLPEEQVVDLAEGRARLAYIPFGSSSPVVPAQPTAPRHSAERTSTPSEMTAQLLARLNAIDSRHEAAIVLESVKGKALEDVARRLSIPTKLSAGERRLAVVEATVGSRIDSVATRGFIGDRP